MKKPYVKFSLTGAAILGPLAPVGFWLGGYDFDVRGADAVFCYIIALVMTYGGVAFGCLIASERKET